MVCDIGTGEMDHSAAAFERRRIGDGVRRFGMPFHLGYARIRVMLSRPADKQDHLSTLTDKALRQGPPDKSCSAAQHDFSCHETPKGLVLRDFKRCRAVEAATRAHSLC